MMRHLLLLALCTSLRVGIAAADPISIGAVRLLQLDPNDPTRLGIDAVGSPLPIEVLPDPVSFWTPVSGASALQVVWAGPEGLLGTFSWEFSPDTDVVVWGMVLPRWYRPMPITVTSIARGLQGSTERSDMWVVFSPVPEPGTLGLVGIGVAGLWRLRRGASRRKCVLSQQASLSATLNARSCLSAIRRRTT
jgi:hypothetical protein